MKKPYKQLLGQRIYLLYPQRKKSEIILGKEAEEKLQMEEMQKLSRLKIYDVGDTFVPDTLKIGMEVLADIARGRKFELNEDVTVIMISPSDVIHIW